jgi:hypothetical protein
MNTILYSKNRVYPSLEDQLLGVHYRNEKLKEFMQALNRTIESKRYKSAKQVRTACAKLAKEWNYHLL